MGWLHSPLFRTNNQPKWRRCAEAARSTILHPVARSNPAARSTPYAPPTPLADLHILDYLELAGSQYKAGRALEMHQTTVCRSLQLMQHQFRLANAPGSPICRYGHNSCLRHLRLAYREHRLMAEQLRIGSDVLHHALLLAMAGVQEVPPRFRSAEHWVALVQHGLLDGAILSSFSLAKPLDPDQEPAWAGIAAVPLGSLGLQLVAQAGHRRSVLLPRQAAMPLLHQALEGHGYDLEQQTAACQEPEAWLKRARDRRLALPVCAELLGRRWLQTHRLELLDEQPALNEQLWLLLPQAALSSKAARLCLRRLRLQVAKLKTMQDSHGIQT